MNPEIYIRTGRDGYFIMAKWETGGKKGRKIVNPTGEPAQTVEGLLDDLLALYERGALERWRLLDLINENFMYV